MNQFKSYNIGFSSSNNPLGFIKPLLVLAVFFTALFFLAKGVFWILSWVAPFLLIITLILDRKVVIDYLQFVWKLLKENSLVGILMVLITIFGFPIVSGFLFLKALGKRSIKNTINQIEKERNSFTEYEEVNIEENEDFLELPKNIRKPEPIQNDKSTNEYNDIFK
ncbi:MAG: hypothetical protein R2774_14020 [Saprospiraceae bacterium]